METRDIPDRIHGVLGLAFIGLSHVHRTFLRNLNETGVGQTVASFPEKLGPNVPNCARKT